MLKRNPFPLMAAIALCGLVFILTGCVTTSTVFVNSDVTLVASK